MISSTSSAYRSSFLSPTPAITARSAQSFGRASAISIKVLSWKITYGGTPSEIARFFRHSRSRSNNGPPADDDTALRAGRPARPDDWGAATPISWRKGLGEAFASRGQDRYNH